MAFAGSLWPGGLHRALGIDQHRAAHDPFEFPAVHFFRAPGVVGFDDGPFDVAQQRDGDLVFLGELAVGFDRVRADPQDNGIKLIEFGREL